MDTECETKNALILRYLSCHAKKAAAEGRLRRGDDSPRARKALENARAAVISQRKELLDHCEQHGCAGPAV
jgi:hypothetical protein